MLERPIITLTTDFGLKDTFAGLMKGVILRINPKANVIDLTHNIQRHNIFEASRTISMSYRYFPPTTIHIVVVDPVVGGAQRPILVVTENNYFIGPDNGTFTSIFEECQSSFFSVYHITASHYFLPMSGNTFHGRDIYSPIAAWLSKGIDLKKLGDPINDFKSIPVSKPFLSDNKLNGEIVSIDNFGNAISNISTGNLAELAPADSKIEFKIGYNNTKLPLVNFYAENESADLGAVINSFGHVELFTFKDNAAAKFGIKTGDSITITID
jgi:S-adenosylmethionine hydrolase